MPKREKRSLTIRDVAERLGITKQAVHGLLNRGKLRRSSTGTIPGRYRNGNAYWISLQSVEELEAERRQSSETEGERDE